MAAGSTQQIVYNVAAYTRSCMHMYGLLITVSCMRLCLCVCVAVCVCVCVCVSGVALHARQRD